MLSALTPWRDNQPSIFETNQLATTLETLVDFDRLNAGPCRYTATAVNLETGDDVAFDSAAIQVGPEHIRASAALPVAFPPVEIDGRWLVDGGLSANLPLDPVLSAPRPRATLCIPVDLLPLHGPKPATLGEAASRMQDLIFAAQSRRWIDRWKATYSERERVTLSLIRLAYTEQDEEVAGKALDFPGPTVGQRWSAGYRAGMLAEDRVQTKTLFIGVPGLNVIQL